MLFIHTYTVLYLVQIVSQFTKKCFIYFYLENIQNISDLYLIESSKRIMKIKIQYWDVRNIPRECRINPKMLPIFLHK